MIWSSSFGLNRRRSVREAKTTKDKSVRKANHEPKLDNIIFEACKKDLIWPFFLGVTTI